MRDVQAVKTLLSLELRNLAQCVHLVSVSNDKGGLV